MGCSMGLQCGDVGPCRWRGRLYLQTRYTTPWTEAWTWRMLRRRLQETEESCPADSPVAPTESVLPCMHRCLYASIKTGGIPAKLKKATTIANARLGAFRTNLPAQCLERSVRRDVLEGSCVLSPQLQTGANVLLDTINNTRCQQLTGGRFQTIGEHIVCPS